MTRRVLLLAMTLVAVPASVVGQTLETPEFKLRFGGRLQTQFSTTNVDAAELIATGHPPSAPIPEYMFQVRRLRLAAELDYQTWLTGKLELEFAMARLQMREVFINFNLNPAFQIRTGQFKKPFSLLQLYTSTRWPVIERGVVQRGLSNQLLAEDVDSVLTIFNNNVVFGEEQSILEAFQYQNYDLGAVVHGSVGRFGYTAGVFNGPGSDQNDDTNGKSFGGRMTLRAYKAAPLTFGAAVMTREFLVTMRPNIITRGGVAWEADVEWGEFRKPGLHLLAEATTGRNLAVPDLIDDQSFAAAQAVAAWYFPVTGHRVEGWELAGRASWGNPRIGVDGDAGILLTPGFNIYFSGRNRFMVNVDMFDPFGAEFSDGIVFRSQAQIYF